MNKNQSISDKIDELISAHLLPILEEKINTEICFIQNFQATVASLTIKNRPAQSETDILHYLQQYQNFSSSLYKLTESRFTERKASSFEELYKKYTEACNEYLHSLRKNKKEIQKQERFFPQPTENTYIKFLKFWKRQFFQISQLPVKTQNILRKIQKKEALPEKSWSQTVPFRKLADIYFSDLLAIQLLPLFVETELAIVKASNAAWEIEEQIFLTYYPFLQKTILNTEQDSPVAPEIAFQEQIEKATSALESHRKKLKKYVKQQINDTLDKFNQAYDQAGTLELPHWKINRQLKHQQHEGKKVYEKTTLEWSNTLFGLHEDWRIDQELNMLSVAQLQAYLTMQQKLHNKIHQNIIPKLDQTKSCIEEILRNINTEVDSTNTDIPALKKILTQSKETVEEKLVRQMLPEVVEMLYKQMLPAIFDSLSTDIQEAILKVSQERGLVGIKSYDSPIKSSEINFVSPYQIVAFESLPKFLDGIYEYQKKVTQEQILIQQRIHEIGQISYFNLDTALSAIEGDMQAEQQPLEIASEGLKRAKKSIDTITGDLAQIKKEAETKLSDSIIEFNNKLNELKNNDYALEIKFRVAKAKAIEQAKAFRQKMLTLLKNFFPSALALTVKTYQEGATLLRTYQKKMGIQTPTKRVTSEISDFLSETTSAINRLPFVYQRLFKIQPIAEEIFYEERTLETERLTTAFENWKKGRYSCAVLVGEKGSGITTLINFFIKRLNQQDQRQFAIIKAIPPEQIWKEASFYDFFNKIFPGNKFQKLENIINFLKTMNQPHIIILEHIERMYLKKIGGFDCLKLMFELISKTSKQVFWISSSTMYSWQYLDNTLHISDYFEYIIRLENIEDKKMCEVILKRHRVSGYGLKFIPPPETSNKKFYKMSEQEQQDYLRDIYFADLNNITDGNFSLAQLFWMRSAHDVTQDTITIGSLYGLDFSFIRAISLSKTIILHLLLLHDGLSEEQYTLLTHQMMIEDHEGHSPKAWLELLQMLDDGLIVKENNLYYINPLLYRPVVSLLKTKNFLH